jgi:hypothetical protein
VRELENAIERAVILSDGGQHPDLLAIDGASGCPPAWRATIRGSGAHRVLRRFVLGTRGTCRRRVPAGWGSLGALGEAGPSRNSAEQAPGRARTSGPAPLLGRPLVRGLSPDAPRRAPAPRASPVGCAASRSRGTEPRRYVR